MITTYTPKEEKGKIFVIEQGETLFWQYAGHARKNFKRKYRDFNNNVLEFDSMEFATWWCQAKKEIMAIM